MTEHIKRASWLELFYDLAFVALIAQVTYLLADHHTTVQDWLHALIVSVVIFTAWWGTTANRNLQDSEGVLDKLAIQLQMIGAFMMSLAMPAVFDGELSQFFLTYAFIRSIQILLIFRLYRIDADNMPPTRNILHGIIVATGLWVVASIVSVPFLYIVAGCAIAIDVLIPLTQGRGNKVRLLNVHHLQERLGLFLMLVIGESMLVVAIANTAASSDVSRPVIVFSGLFLMMALWWLYYGYLERHGEGKRPKNLFIYQHAHNVLFVSVVILAAAYKNMLKHNEPTITDLTLVGAGYVAMLASLLMIRLMLGGVPKRKRLTAILFCVGAIVIMVAGWQYHMPLLAITVLTVSTVVMAAVDHWKSYRVT